MVRTVITPDNQNISLHIPENYVGKQIEVLIYDIDEVNQPEPAPTQRKHSDFRGKLNLSDEQYADFQTHLKNIRDEWESDI